MARQKLEVVPVIPDGSFSSAPWSPSQDRVEPIQQGVQSKQSIDQPDLDLRSYEVSLILMNNSFSKPAKRARLNKASDTITVSAGRFVLL